MSFKLTNAPAIFQTYINNVLKEHLNMFVVVYLDDILVYLKNKSEHKQQIRQVLTALKKADLRINVKYKAQQYYKYSIISSL